MAEQNYAVMREHDGDRFYRKGDTRTLQPVDAANLLRLGVLAEPSAGGVLAPSAQIGALTVDQINIKAEAPVVENKAEGAAPENKAAASVAAAKDGAISDGSSDPAATDAGA